LSWYIIVRADKGTAFHPCPFSSPKGAGEEEESVADESIFRGNQMTVPKILIVDDDPGVLRLLELSLQRGGYRVVTAITGELGVEKVRTERPDLLLVDVMMPGIDGFETTRRIRRTTEGRQVPIIFLSSVMDMEAKVMGLREGADDYVTKPVKMGELLARIDARLRSDVPLPGRLVPVFGSRAGVGTTTVAVNLALALRKIAQKKVLLLDWQRPFGDVSLFLGIQGASPLESLLPGIDEMSDEMFSSVVHEYEPGVQVILGATGRDSAARMDRNALNRVLDMALDRADFVLIDAGTFFSWDSPPLVSKEGGIGLCVLTPATLPMRRTAQALGMVDVMRHEFWPILNRYDPQSASRRQIESELGTIIYGCVPEEADQASRALDKGCPLYIVDPTSGFSHALDNIAKRMYDFLSP
jgi:DNA-binding response OmpR family regulator